MQDCKRGSKTVVFTDKMISVCWKPYEIFKKKERQLIIEFSKVVVFYINKQKSIICINEQCVLYRSNKN